LLYVEFFCRTTAGTDAILPFAGEDVAAMLGLPPSHVAVLLQRAKQRRRSRMLSAGYRP
jgi:DNA-directed RNA polymerase specialized sigma24 family protein